MFKEKENETSKQTDRTSEGYHSERTAGLKDIKSVSYSHGFEKERVAYPARIVSSDKAVPLDEIVT